MLSSTVDADGDLFIVKNNGNVGIGTSTPAAKLEVAGEVKITGGSPGVGKVLTSNSSGLATWQTPYTGDNDWTISGNDMYSGVSGNVGIGTSTPDAKLTVENGTIKAISYLEDSEAFCGLATGSYSSGVYGWSSSGTGVRGESSSGDGVIGESSGGGDGVRGESSTGNGVHGEGGASGVFGWCSGEGVGVCGVSSSGKGVGGSSSSNDGVYGESISDDGVCSVSISGNGVHGESSSGYAGRFDGDVLINGGHLSGGGSLTITDELFVEGNLRVGGNLYKGGGSFKIDHPLDPANKFLLHSFVESPDMMNIYNGNVILDKKGRASVMLPEWFQSLNKEFRYQLTCIGGFAPVYIAEKISGNHFKIAGGKPGMEVSWQVTGIRQDPYAVANRIVVEEDKPVYARGYYLHPEVYGQSKDRNIENAPKPSLSEERQMVRK
jgi:hypothetical protein